MSPAPRAPRVVLLHGLWMPAWSLLPLERRLRRSGFATTRFAYRSWSGALAPAAQGLRAWLQDAAAGELHLVGHSLGGLLLLELYRLGYRHPGRAVALGSPFAGSLAARRLGACGAGRWLLGRNAEPLRHGGGTLPGDVELGVIAGARPWGLGRWVTGVPAPSDGTVRVAETRLEGARDRILLPLTHLSLLTARSAAEETAHFLRHGCFSPGPSRSMGM
ncbi:MAG TPA: alpha/beta fold hydrolase [Gammaproteobacteria bacterium]